MIPFNRYILFIIVCFTSVCMAVSQSVHQHGVVTGTLVVQDTDIQLQLTIPAMSLFGFEHAPHTHKEQHHVATVLQKLNQQTWFQFYSKGTFFGKSKSVDTNVTSQVFSIQAPNPSHSTEHNDHHHDHHHHGNHKKVQERHSDVVGTLQFKHATDKPITGLKTTLFDQFPDIQNIRLQVVLNNKQFEAVCTNKQVVCKLKEYK